MNLIQAFFNFLFQAGKLCLMVLGAIFLVALIAGAIAGARQVYKERRNKK